MSDQPARPLSTLAAWRAQRTQARALPSGLPVVLRKVQLLDLAAQGQIPAALYGQVEQLMNLGASPILLAEFPQYAQVIDLVVRAALVAPPLADAPDEEHLSLAELSFSDRLDIFNWAQEEAAQVATFPGDGGARARTPRGRERVRGAPVEPAARVVDGLADRPDGAGPGDPGAAEPAPADA